MKKKNDEEGSILVLTALMMTVLMGVMALATDVSFMYDLKQRLGAAADSAAIAGALEVQQGNPSYATFAQSDLTLYVTNNQLPVGVNANIHLCSDPGATCAAYPNPSRFVEVILSYQQPTFFARVLGRNSMTPVARAVAGSADSHTCWVIFDDLKTQNNDVIDMHGCGIEIGDDVLLGNGSSITAPSIGVGDMCCGSGNVTPAPTHIGVPVDPLKDLLPPIDPDPTACSAPLTIASNATLNPGHYCGWQFNGNGNTLTLNPGVYYITGPITAKAAGKDANIVGAGVLLYFAPGGYIDLDANHVSMNLSAPPAGQPYSGILFYQDRLNTHADNFAKNNGDFTFSGASYFPSADVVIKNNLGWASNCTLFVAHSLETKNNAAINNDCSAYGGTPWKRVALAE